MSDSQPQKLSEIGHLFLSSVRDAAGNGNARPMRTPPGAQRPLASIDLTPADFEPSVKAQANDPIAATPRRVPVTIALAGHLGANATSRVTRLASQLCEDGRRVGLVCLDTSELSISVFDRENGSEIHGDGSTQDASGQPRAVTQALDELAWDVDQWLLYTPTTRDARAHQIFTAADEWLLLSTCDHDGVVSSYRVLKGLAELPPPSLSLVCVDAAGAAEARSAFERIDGVCQQFLEWSVVDHSDLSATPRFNGHPILRACWSTGQADAFWTAAAEFFAPQSSQARIGPRIAAPVMREIPQSVAAKVSSEAIAMTNEFPSVIDLPADHASASAVVSAVINAGMALTATAIKPPMCLDASVAIDADRRLTLVAVAKQGLGDLKLIGRAYQWLIENRALVAMALPTMPIDAAALPHLSLLVDQLDLSAELLQPLMLTGSVTVTAYRKLRWGDRVGMLLEAA